MKTPNFSSYSDDEIIQFGLEANPDQIQQYISKMSAHQASTLVAAFKDEREAKIRAVIIGLDNREELEAIGSVLSITQFQTLLDSCLQVEDKHHWKLSPLLVGMEHSTFSKVIEVLTEQQLKVFKEGAITEPIQHHLTQLAHALGDRLQNEEEQIGLLYEEVDQLDLDVINAKDVQKIIENIHQGRHIFEFIFEKSNKALAIAWNTQRLDLIESFSQIKGSCQKYVLYGLGSPARDQQPATGLYQLVEERLFSVYGDTHVVLDSEPATEGLAKLSIWYLKDYREIGLLPGIEDPSSLDLSMEDPLEFEKAGQREELFHQAQKNLEQLGLSTVKDLKENYIFSKKTLCEFIREKMPPLTQPD